MTAIKRSAAEIIAMHFCTDIAEVRDMIYQPTRYSRPSIYTMGDDYYCCPSARQKPPRDADGFDDSFKWEPLASYYGRTIFCSKAGGIE